MKMKMVFISVYALIISTLVSMNTLAAVPDLIPIQGVLSDTSGNPIDGLTDLTFSLYAEETDEIALWADTFTDVDVVDGFFSVYLGSDDILDFSSFLSNAQIWIGITVESDPEMNRIRLAAVPFAIEAEVCEQVGSLTEEDINNNFIPSSSAAASITSDQISNWDSAYDWGDHASAGYLTFYNETDPEFFASPAAGIDDTNITNWDTAYGWGDHASAGYASSSHNHAASDVTSGTFDNTRVNWAAPGNIGSTTAASGSFTSLTANNGLSVSAGTVNIKPGGSGGTNGQVLKTDGSGNATWQNAGTSSLSVTTQNSNYTILTTDGFIITNGGVTFTLPTAVAAGAGKILYLYSKVSLITILPASGNTIWDASGNSYTNPSTMTSYSGLYISDGVSSWFEVAK